MPTPETTSLDVNGATAVLGGLKGVSATYLIETDQVERSIQVEEPVTATLCAGSRTAFATSQGSVKVYQGEDQVADVTEHAGAATGLSAHPGGQIMASVGSDKSIVFYELSTMRRISRAYTDSGMFTLTHICLTFCILTIAALTTCAFHPDGHLIAAGTTSGKIKLFMTTTLEQAAEFDIGAPLQAITFSENGFWLAGSAKGQTTVTIFDLRKEGAGATAKVLETGGPVQSLSWDYTGQFLATGGPSGITVQQYLKSSKAWSEPFRGSVPAVAVRWGQSGRKLVSVNGEGVVMVFGIKA